MRVSLKTIAERADFGVSTVSYVLSGKAEQMKIPAVTRDKILAAARELGYERNPIAASLSTGRTGFVALLSQSYPFPWRERRQARAAARLTELGYHVHMFDLHWDAGNPQRMVREITSLQPEGVLVSELVRSGMTDMLQRMIDRGIAVVGLDNLDELPCDCAYLDRVATAEIPTRYLLEQGHRDIGYVIDPSAGGTYSRDRRIGFERAHTTFGLTVDPSQYIWPEVANRNTQYCEVGYQCAPSILDAGVSAVLFQNDANVLGFEKACAERGVRIPQDISVIGAENDPQGAYFPVAVTTLDYPIDALINAAADMLRHRINGGKGKPKRKVFEPKLLLRDSVRAV